jgi:Sulfite oxidase and related enzymes
MKPVRAWLGLLSGAAVSLMGMALSYLGNAWLGWPFFPFVLFDWLTRHLPGKLIDFTLNILIQLIAGLHLGPTAATAKLAEHVLALGLVLVAGMLLGLGLAWLLKARAPAGNGRPAQGSAEPGSVLEKKLTRRGLFVLAGGGLISAMVLWLGLERFAQPEPSAAVTTLSTPTPAAGSLPYGPEYTSGPAASPSPARLAARIAPAVGTRPEVTSVKDFYRIDINSLPPRLEASTWRLEISGLVRQPLSLSLDQIRAFPSVSQAVTLSCISNLVGGDLIGSNFWTGVRAKDLLNEAGLLPKASEIAMLSADDYYEGMTLAEAMDERTLFVYAMNGEPLTAAHGFPLRLYVADRYGMRLPKWLTKLNVIDGPNRGYWTARGWSATAIPMTMSIIDTIYADAAEFKKTGLVPLGGIAWAGDRGISKVEVQIDGGEWSEVQLRDPALSPLTWVEWRYDWPAASGLHQVKVRATDGQGNLQTPRTSLPSPEGATGYEEVTITV